MNEPKARPKTFSYKTNIKWREGRKGTLFSLGKPDLETAPPPEFKGMVGFWTPEDLLVASVNSCFLMTFLFYVEKENIPLVSYECDAEGTLELVERHLTISRVKLMPRVSVRLENGEEKINSLLRVSKEHCFISNSIKAQIEIVPEIKITP